MSARFGLEIRGAQASDAPFLADLLVAAGHAVAPTELARRLDVLRGAPGAQLLASDWGPPIGLIVVAWSPSLLAARPTAWVTTLLVAADARRRGIGRALLKAAAQGARQAGCGDLRLVAPELAAGLPDFATATGFLPAGGVFARALRKSAVRGADED